MPQQVGRGGTIHLDAVFRDGALVATDAVNPQVDILNPSSVEVVTNAVPTRDGVGQYSYDYAVDVTADLGAWSIHWSGLVNGSPVTADEGFTVVAAGSISFDSGFGGACEAWCTSADVTTCAPDLAGEDEAIMTGIAVATDVLFELSAHQYPGRCADVVRPVLVDGASSLCGDRYIRDAILQGKLFATDYRGCDDHGLAGCGCGGFQQLRLGGYPVTSITQVLVDGIALDPSAYMILDKTWLVRVDDGVFSCCQDPTEPATEVGTTEVSYVYGQRPPPSGVRAAARLAAEVARACVGSDSCQLPERVTTIVRQGTTIAMLDPQDFLDHGRTGLYLVDLFLKAINPHDLRDFSTVTTPDYRRAGWRLS